MITTNIRYLILAVTLIRNELIFNQKPLQTFYDERSKILMKYQVEYKNFETERKDFFGGLYERKEVPNFSFK